MTAAAAPSRQARPRPVRRCDALGVSALVLGMIGVGMGLFAAGATWFVVVPIGLLTMILGLIDVSRSRHDVTADGRTAVTGVIAGAIALALGIWGTGMFLGELNDLSLDLSSPTTTHALPTTVPWGQNCVLANGLTVTATPPVRTPTGVQLMVTVSNHTATAVSLNPPTVTFAGQPITDSGAKPMTVPARATVTYRMNVHVQAQAGELRLEFQPQGVISGPA